MKFVHIGDCHLGGWRQKELQELNFQNFRTAISFAIKEKVDFLIVTGDLFDSPYPSIDILKETFGEFRSLAKENIPVYLIAGSHDYSVSGKTFLDVLEKAGLCTNVTTFEEREGKIMLFPKICRGAAIYGYPGKKSGLEAEELSRVVLQDAPGMFKILMLHTTLSDAAPNLPIKMVDHTLLPKVDYLGLSHLHINYQKENRVYSGPIFPNSLSELIDLKGGSFYFFDNGQIRRVFLQTKPIVLADFEVTNSLSASSQILSYFEDKPVADAIVILSVKGIVQQGKTSDIDFVKIEQVLKQKGAFLVLKSTTQLHIAEPDISLDLQDTEQIESQLIHSFKEKNPSTFNPIILQLIKTLQAEQAEDESSLVFSERVLSECRNIITNHNEDKTIIT